MLEDTIFSVVLLLQRVVTVYRRMPAVDFTIKHKLCQRSSKPCSERPNVSDGMHRKSCVYRLRLGC